MIRQLELNLWQQEKIFIEMGNSNNKRFTLVNNLAQVVHLYLYENKDTVEISKLFGVSSSATGLNRKIHTRTKYIEYMIVVKLNIHY